MVYRFIASSDALCLAVCTLGDVLQNYGLLPNQEREALGIFTVFTVIKTLPQNFAFLKNCKTGGQRGPGVSKDFVVKEMKNFPPFLCRPPQYKHTSAMFWTAGKRTRKMGQIRYRFTQTLSDWFLDFSGISFFQLAFIFPQLKILWIDEANLQFQKLIRVKTRG